MREKLVEPSSYQQDTNKNVSSESDWKSRIYLIYTNSKFKDFFVFV